MAFSFTSQSIKLKFLLKRYRRKSIIELQRKMLASWYIWELEQVYAHNWLATYQKAHNSKDQNFFECSKLAAIDKFLNFMAIKSYV